MKRQMIGSPQKSTKAQVKFKMETRREYRELPPRPSALFNAAESLVRSNKGRRVLVPDGILNFFAGTYEKDGEIVRVKLMHLWGHRETTVTVSGSSDKVLVRIVRTNGAKEYKTGEMSSGLLEVLSGLKYDREATQSFSRRYLDDREYVDPNGRW